MGITTYISEAFGNVAFADNATSKVTGTGNTGTIQSNSYLLVSAADCKLFISDSSKVKLNVVKSNVNLKSCSKSTFKGTDNNLVLENSKKVAFKGDGNDLTANANTKLKFRVNGSVLKVFNNKHVYVHMNNGFVTADGNLNLIVKGQGGNVNVKETLNHKIEQATDNQNRLNVGLSSKHGKRCGIMSRIAGVWGNNNTVVNPKVTVGLTYIKDVTVDQKDYKLDNFNFTIEPETKEKYNVNLKDTGLDSGSLVVKTISPTEVQVSGTKDGTKQVLKVTSPVAVSPKKDEDNVITIDLSGAAEQKS